MPQEQEGRSDPDVYTQFPGKSVSPLKPLSQFEVRQSIGIRSMQKKKAKPSEIGYAAMELAIYYYSVSLPWELVSVRGILPGCLTPVLMQFIVHAGGQTIPVPALVKACIYFPG